MSRRSNETPSFFKVLSNVDYSKLLRLPPAFLRRYELNVAGNVQLRGDDSGRRWNVKVERMDDGLLCFTNGWEKFVEDASLKLGEFLVFSLLSKSEFSVVIFETSCCKREIPLVELHAHGHGWNVRKAAKDDMGLSERNGYSKESIPVLYYETCLKARHKSRISLPKKFSGNMKVREVRLEYDEGDAGVSFAATLRPQKAGRIDVGKGWYDFRVANALLYDQIYSFEMKADSDEEDQVIYVKAVK